MTLEGRQNQLSFIGTVGGKGTGPGFSTCPVKGEYPHDYRYNVVSKTASCTQEGTGRYYSAPVEVTGGHVSSGGPFTRLAIKQYGSETFEVWGGHFISPSNIGPIPDGISSGEYSMDIAIDVSSLPVGKYKCGIKNSHGGYATYSNSTLTGVNTVFNEIAARNFWAYQDARNIEIKAACEIPDSLEINHGSVASGATHLESKQINVKCNATTSMKVTLIGDSAADSDGVTVNMMGGSKSKLSLIGEGGGQAKELSFSLQPNASKQIEFKSNLQAKGDGHQEGSAIAQFVYN
ncbi:TPA: hypothetical protein L9M98_004692 [Klebsiella pneumoniae]|nr:hypothetical protein [Klebsiella pneumoniae]